MSALMLDLEEKPVSRTAPPKLWRNWYWVIAPIQLHQPIKQLWRRGVHPGPCVFPSKDMAETRARDFLAEQSDDFRWRVTHYEAWPEGEKPEA